MNYNWVQRITYFRLFSYDRMNIQRNNCNTTYQNITLIHNMYQPAQETNLLSTVTGLGSQTTIFNN